MNWQQFNPNVDLMRSFNTKYQLIDDIPGCENGFSSMKAGVDGPPIHKHPHQKQEFAIVEGEVEVYLGGKWNKLKAGDRVTIPPNTPHSYRSRAKEDCLFEYRIIPGGHFSDMIRCFGRLTDAGIVKGTKDVKSLAHFALAFKKYKHDVVSVNPPDWVISLFAAYARLRGYSIS
jgi:mannose-6-phosphate isomerase-like protein (cupin superfamily)